MPVLTKGLNPGGLVPATSKEEALNAANRSILTGMKQLLRKEKLPAETIDEVIPYVNSGNAQTALVAIRVVGMLQNKRERRFFWMSLKIMTTTSSLRTPIMALGDLRDPKAADTLITYLFKERGFRSILKRAFLFTRCECIPLLLRS